MKINQILEYRDMCNVCGQTPCNCTHVIEGADERKQNALWAQITAHEKAAKKSKDLKQQHHLKMADQLRSQLKTSDLNEFAPGSGDDREPNEEEILRQLAAQWWSGTEQQMARAQQALEAMGWEIGPDESGDEDAGVYVYRIGDDDGKYTIAFGHSELSLNEAVAEGAGNVGNAIKSLYQKIYAAGDDEVEYFYNDSPIFAQYWDEYEGDLDSIIAEVDPGELQVILDELESYVQNANLAEGWTKLPSGDYINQHTGVRSSKPPVKKKRGEKTGAEWDAIEKAKKDKEPGVAEGLNEFAPNDDGGEDRDHEYEVYQCNPDDQFDWIGGPIYKTDDMGKAHNIAYNLHKKYPNKAFMIWQERSQGSRGGYGIKDDEQGVAEGSLNEFAPGGNSASSYYAVTANFVNEFAQQKQEELQDLIDAGWTKQDLAQAGTLEGNASDIAHFEQVRDSFLKGLKPGFDAYLRSDTQLKDQLGAYWMENDLPLNQDWEKIYGEPWGDDGLDEGDVTHTPTGLIHRAKDKYGAGEEPFSPVNPGKYARDLDHVNKQQVKDLDASMGITWKNRGTKGVEVDESKPKEKEADYGADYQDMVARVKKLAGLGPLKTVYDPKKRVYRNMPTAVQPKK